MLKAITSIFGRTLYADSEENWQKRQAIRTKKCHAYLKRRGYACKLDDVGFGLEEAIQLSNTLMASTPRNICKAMHDAVSQRHCRFSSKRLIWII